MRKILYLPLFLLSMIAVGQDREPANDSVRPFPSPVIVAKRKLVNQTAPIPTTTIFMPTQSGLYRLTAYATLTKDDSRSQSLWSYNLGWTDDAGGQVANSFLFTYGTNLGQFISDGGVLPYGGAVVPFEAKAGTPITFSMLQIGGPDDSAYLLYFTLERLE